MATTKKSTKAKTKTVGAKTSVKKSTTKRASAVRTSNSRAKTKSADRKSSAANKSAPAKSKRLRGIGTVTVQRLRSLNMISAGLFLLLAVAAGALMTGDSFQLTLGHVAKDELTGGFAPAVQSVYDVELRWLAVAALVLAAVAPVLYLTRLQTKYNDYVTNTRMQPWRWVDAGVTGAIAVGVFGLLVGVSDIPTLKLLSAVVVVAAILGLITERQNSDKPAKPVKSAFYTGIFAGVVLALFLGAYLVASVVYGSGVEWYVYALYAVLVVGFALLVRNMRKLLHGANNLAVERNYIVINMLVKTAFAVVLIVGLLRDF